MTARTWLFVSDEALRSIADHASAITLEPLPVDLAPGDRVAVVSWPGEGTERRAVLAGTATVRALSPENGTVRVRRRVAAVARHEVPVSALGTKLAAARGWTPQKREALVGTAFPIRAQDFALIDETLLGVARAFGPRPRRPQHRRPRTPGRRAMLAGRASVRGSPGTVRTGRG